MLAHQAMSNIFNNQPRLVKILNNKLSLLNKVQESDEKLKIIENVFATMIENLVTFGPTMKIVYDEYQIQMKKLRKRIFIEETLRRR